MNHLVESTLTRTSHLKWKDLTMRPGNHWCNATMTNQKPSEPVFNFTTNRHLRWSSITKRMAFSNPSKEPRAMLFIQKLRNGWSLVLINNPNHLDYFRRLLWLVCTFARNTDSAVTKLHTHVVFIYQYFSKGRQRKTSGNKSTGTRSVDMSELTWLTGIEMVTSSPHKF